MGLLFKKRVRADLAGWNLTAALIDPDDCWHDICLLRSYDVPDPIATCEMAFARTAIVRDAIKATQSGEVATLMLAAAHRLIKERFSTEDTPETFEYYSSQRLADIGPKIIQLYEKSAFPLTLLADLFASRLGVPGVAAVEICPMFVKVGDAARKSMKRVRIVP
ncbi:MAG: hypothetical protein ACREC1_03020 [Methylovirgula sp.]